MLILGLAMLQALLAGQGDTYRYISKKGNYTQGRQYCQAYSLDLATVASKHDLEYMKTTYFPTRTYLFWLGAHYNGTSFIWPGGEPVLLTNWGLNEPNDLETDHCVAVSTGRLTLHTRKCEESHPSMCGKNEPICKVAYFSRITRKQGSLKLSSTFSTRHVSDTECGNICLELKNCTHFSMNGTWCQLYDNCSEKTRYNVDLEIWRRN